MRKRLIFVLAVVLPLSIAMICGDGSERGASGGNTHRHPPLGHGPGGRLREHRRPRRRAVCSRTGKRQDISRRSGHRDAHDVRALPAGVGDPTRRSDGRRVHRQHPVRAGHARQRPIPRTDRGPSRVDGIYRVDGLDSCSVVADIGAFAVAHTPNANIFLVTGVQYAMTPYRGGFLVTDGHHNRVYRVTLDGTVSEFITFGNVVPTGLQVFGNTIYMAEAGHDPHHGPRTARSSHSARAGPPQRSSPLAPLLVDVERGRGHTLFGLSQGIPPATNSPARLAGTPATPDRSVDGNGGLTEVAARRARPANLARDHRDDRIRHHARRRDLEDRQHLRAELRTLSNDRRSHGGGGPNLPPPSTSSPRRGAAVHAGQRLC